jgi:TonB-linked SusC/RagA family outer membrane protein
MNFYIKSLCRPRAGMAKILLVMKLIVILLTTAILQVSASSYGQNVTLKQNNAKLTSVLDQIRKQTGYDFFYSQQIMENAKPVNINLNQVDIEKALEMCFKDQPLTYTIENKIVTIKEKEKSFLENIIARFQNIDVRGRVVDEKGEQLVGASVSVKGGRGTTSDKNGEFYLVNVDEKASLRITYIGYVAKEVSAKSDLGEIKLELEDSKLNEVQVIGYGEVEKRFSTTTVGTIKGEQISRQPVSNPLLALQGRVPGLFIQQGSGVNGSQVTVQIQGKNSLQNTSDPFYVVDGVPYTAQFTNYSLMGTAIRGVGGNTFNFINPADIESVSILKDADATAIYGSRAANGAILITTKKGKPGKTKVDLNLQSGWGKVTRKLDLMNTDQYLEIRREAFKNAGQPVPTSSSTPNPTNYDIVIWGTEKNTDWQKELVGGTAAYTDLQASVSGGNAGTRFLAGYGYHRETTVYPGDLSDVKGNFHFNVDHNSTNNKFKFLLSGSYMQDKNKLNSGDLMTPAITMAPNIPDLYNADGTLNRMYLPGTTTSIFSNPLTFTIEQFTGNTSNLIANNVMSYEILPGLALKASIGYNKLQSDESKFRPLAYFDPSLPQEFQTRSVSTLNKSITSWIIEPQVTYSKETKFGVFDAVIGSTFQQRKTEVLQQTGSGYPTDESMGNLLAATTRTVDAVDQLLYKYTAVFGRINYRLLDKYIINLTTRRDGSSRFGDDNKFNNFYSVGAAWLFGNEDFVKQNATWLSFGKLKANYGTTGNDQFDDYSYLSLLGNYFGASIPYQQSTILVPSNIANPLLQWEETRKLNVGVDLGFIKNRFLLNVNYFRNRSSNQLINYQIPTMTGFESVYSNYPAVVQNIGWEAELNVLVIKGKGINWSSSVNLTIPKNKLVAFPGLETTPYASIYVIGQPVNITKRYQFAGVNATTGLYEFINAKGERTSAPSSTTDRTAIFDPNPKYYGGWSNTISYKGFELDFLFQFVKQMGNTYYYGNNPGAFNLNQPISIIKRWQNPGDVTDVQKISRGADVNTPRSAANNSTAVYGDASFIRLKNASLSYALPEFITKKAGMSNARIYTQAQNLLTITKYEGSDPESLSPTKLPPLRMITIGLQITF